jgi:hypothetical protein
MQNENIHMFTVVDVKRSWLYLFHGSGTPHRMLAGTATSIFFG